MRGQLNKYCGNNMKTIKSKNRTNITFNVIDFGNLFTDKMNQIHFIAKKHNAQVNVYSNASHLKFDKNSNIIGFDFGNAGGSITFHSHSCDHESAASELISLLESYGYKNEKFEEVIKTHKEDGTPYKKPQTFIEKVK